MFDQDYTYRTWVLVADGSKARLLGYDTSSRQFKFVESEMSHINKASRDLTTGKQGRVFQSATASRSAMEWPSDPHELEKRKFAKEIVDYLADKQLIELQNL